MTWCKKHSEARYVFPGHFISNLLWTARAHLTLALHGGWECKQPLLRIATAVGQQQVPPDNVTLEQLRATDLALSCSCSTVKNTAFIYELAPYVEQWRNLSYKDIGTKQGTEGWVQCTQAVAAYSRASPLKEAKRRRRSERCLCREVGFPQEMCHVRVSWLAIFGGTL